MKKIGRITKTLVLAAITVVLLYAIASHGNNAPGDLAPVPHRKPMPDLTFNELNGSTWNLSSHRGRVVLLNMWATWCPPCREETPGLVRLANSYNSNQVAVVGISMDEGGPDTVRQFAADYRIPYAIAMADNGFTLGDSVDALPTTLLIDKAGRLAKTYVGGATEHTFRTDIDALLAEKGD